MKFDGTKPLIDFAGNQLLGGPGNALLTTGSVACDALGAALEDPHVKQAEKQRRFLLACEISRAKLPIEISLEDVALICRLVDKAFPAPMVSGQFAALVDPAPAETAAATASSPAANGAHLDS